MSILHMKRRAAGMQLTMCARQPRRLCRALLIVEGLASQ